MLDFGQNYFDKQYAMVKARNTSEIAYQNVIEAYLDGKPLKKGKRNAQISRHELFWHSDCISKVPLTTLKSEDFILALANYFTQESTSNLDMMERVLNKCPELMRKAIRRSELVLKPQHGKWSEVRLLSIQYRSELKELVTTCEAFQEAHKQRVKLVKKYCEPFNELTLFEFLAYSAAYSFQYLATKAISFEGGEISTDTQLRGLTKLVKWKLSIASASDFTLNEEKIIQSLKSHHVPLIFPSNEDSTFSDALLHRFGTLVQVQVELDEFLSQSVHPFCFDDSLHFLVNDSQLNLTTLDTDEVSTWERNGTRQKMLRGYWFNRAMDEYIASGMASKQIGSVENNERNLVAYVKALSSVLELQNVYGLEEFVATERGINVNLFQAILAQELMIAFYIKEYIEAFQREYSEVKHWQKAASLVAMKGLATGQNRFPISWTTWNEKVRNIIGWTVNKDFPYGNKNAAEAILEFWSFDMKKLSAMIKNDSNSKIPHLTERPIFKIGAYSIQLPWLMATQIGSINVVNNLRRFPNQRSSLKEETTRIENRLGDKFQQRGFEVIKNYTANGSSGVAAGEIDLICGIDNVVIIIEVKSTYCRTTQAEVVNHRDRTLRKAGIQVRKKVDAIKSKFEKDCELQRKLHLSSKTPEVIGWIADTSIEFDHEYFSGFLKITIEELLIALADNAYLLCNQEELVTSANSFTSEPYTLYEYGFSGREFVKTIEESRVWSKNEIL